MKPALAKIIKKKVIVIDGPRQVNYDPAVDYLRQRGWQVILEDLVATEVGEFLARRRALLMAAIGGG